MKRKGQAIWNKLVGYHESYKELFLYSHSVWKCCCIFFKWVSCYWGWPCSPALREVSPQMMRSREGSTIAHCVNILPAPPPAFVKISLFYFVYSIVPSRMPACQKRTPDLLIDGRNPGRNRFQFVGSVVKASTIEIKWEEELTYTGNGQTS